MWYSSNAFPLLKSQLSVQVIAEYNIIVQQPLNIMHVHCTCACVPHVDLGFRVASNLSYWNIVCVVWNGCMHCQSWLCYIQPSSMLREKCGLTHWLHSMPNTYTLQGPFRKLSNTNLFIHTIWIKCDALPNTGWTTVMVIAVAMTVC